jgi:hypothetical protein
LLLVLLLRQLLRLALVVVGMEALPVRAAARATRGGLQAQRKRAAL